MKPMVNLDWNAAPGKVSDACWGGLGCCGETFIVCEKRREGKERKEREKGNRACVLLVAPV